MHGSSGNQALLFTLGAIALTSVPKAGTYYSVQRHHPDGKRWVDVAHFASQEDADAAVRALVDHDEGSDGDFRVQKVTREMA